jgi:hypothetical protein
MGKRRIYTGTFKVKIVMEYIEKKMSLSTLADKYQVHPNLIKNWKSILLKRAHLVLDDGRINRRDSSPPLCYGCRLGRERGNACEVNSEGDLG